MSIGAVTYCGQFRLSRNHLINTNYSLNNRITMKNFLRLSILLGFLFLATGDINAQYWMNSPGIGTGISLANSPTKSRVGVNTNLPRGTMHMKTEGIGYQFIIESESTADAPDFLFAVDGKTRTHFKYLPGNGYGIYVNNNPTSLSALTLSSLGIFVSGDNQSVGIKTVNIPTDFDFAVNGKMICEEVRVQLAANWPDYVFQPEYELMPLEELEASIEENSHLPGVPSAAVIESRGIDMGEISKIQMEKIEELTLYIIDLKKQNDAMQENNETMMKRLAALEALVSTTATK